MLCYMLDRKLTRRTSVDNEAGGSDNDDDEGDNLSYNMVGPLEVVVVVEVVVIMIRRISIITL